jgi:hypothetical protein
MDMAYESLPKGNYIRILEVWVDSYTRELVCKFKVICLDSNTHDYKAVSYTWGDPAPVSRIKFSDGRSFPLSYALSNLFNSLRKRDEEFTVWIDAICINQEDNIEKASQVALMGKVYSSTEQVLLWLGDSTIETRNAFRFMESKQTFSWPEEWDEQRDLSGLDTMFSLLDRPWFRRVWVIQEVTLSHNVLMLCGSDQVDFDTFRDCIFAIWKFFEDFGDFDDDDPAILGLWGVTTLIAVRDEFHESGAVRYEILLQAAFHFLATDKRDMVFAFRGIGDKDRPVPEPDYIASVEDIYTKTAIVLLCHGTSLDVLALSGIANRQQQSNLPTWVPDLRHYSFSEPFTAGDNASWNAGGPLQVQPSAISPEQLRLQVKVLDEVQIECTTFDSYLVSRQKMAVQEILALRERLVHEVSEEAWKDILAFSMTLGLDLDDDPVGPEYRIYFNEWLEWLQSSSTEEDLRNISSNKFQRTLGPKIDGLKAFMTKQKTLFCIGFQSIEVGDILCVVLGCRLLLILRSDPKASSTEPLREYILVCWCYAHGFMDSENIDPEQATIDILLR